MAINKPTTITDRQWATFNKVLSELKRAYTVIMRPNYPPEHYKMMSEASQEYRKTRPSEEYSRIGKLGAQRRWHPQTENTNK